MISKHKFLKSSILSAVASSIFGLSSLSIEARGDEYTRGIAAYESGDYSKAFELIKLSAESGDAKSQLILSTMYRRGIGIEKDEYEGFFWCKEAAEQEILEAKFHLGLMYMDGEGVTEDQTEAEKWLWDAASLGYPQATEILQYLFSEDFDIEEANIGC